MINLKKSLLFFFVIGSLQISNAQFWLDVAGKGGVGIGGLYNSNLWNDTDHNNQFNLGYSYGGRVGLNFGEHNGLMLEAVMMNGKQEFNHKLSQARIPNITKWQTLDLWALYRFNNTGSYLEIGPGMNLLRSVEHNYNGLPIETVDLYADRMFSIAGGFGGFIAGSEFFTLIAGIRLGYTFTDMLSETGQNASNPPPAPYQSYNKYSAINPFFAQFTLELSFGIGGVAKAQCGRRSYLFGSRYR